MNTELLETAVIVASVRKPEAAEAAIKAGITTAAFRSNNAATVWKAIDKLESSDENERDSAIALQLPPEALEWWFNASERVEAIGAWRLWLSELCAIVRRLETAKALRTAEQRLAAGEDHEEIEAELLAARERISKITMEPSNNQRAIADTVLAEIDAVLRRLAGGELDEKDILRTLDWFIPEIARKFGEIRPTDQIVVAGRPGWGKSSFARCQVLHVLSRGGSAMIQTGEMGPEEVCACLAATAAGVSSDMRATASELRQLRDSVANLRSLMGERLFISAETSLSAIEREYDRFARENVKTGLPALVVVDYLQLVDARLGRSSKREEEVATVSRRLKQSAIRCQVPCMALSQLNRDGARDEPSLHHLRESGAIEQDANKVLFIYGRDEDMDKHPRPVKLKCAKNRNGPVGCIDLMFSPKTTDFHMMADPSHGWTTEANPF